MISLRTKALAALLAAALASGALFFWLSREFSFYAFVAFAILFFGGYRLLPDKNLYAHALSIGLCIGAFIGGVIGFGSWAHVAF